MKRQLQISVRDLVSYCLRSGDLVHDFGFGSGIRGLEGIRAHQKVQNSRPAEYKVEVTISHQVETEDFIVDIGGRLDGVYRYPDRAVIDEIKSTARDLAALEKRQNPVHWGQVKVYAYFYALQEDLESIGAQLTYFHLGTGKTREFRNSFARDELETFFNRMMERYLGWLRTLEQWYERRDLSIEELSFPFIGYRPGQQQMMDGVYQCILSGGQLMVEAPTGIGKTMASVFPAVRAIGTGMIDKFFYLTAKTTGRSVAQKALKDLRSKGLRFKALTLTAKEKICFSPGKLCNGEECQFARGYYDRINEAVEAIFEQEDAMTRLVVEDYARRHGVCPFEYSMELSSWVDAIICDYNYVFDPRVYMKRFFGEEAEAGEYAFLVDEANNMVDRAREMFSAELYNSTLLDLHKKVKTPLPDMADALDAVLRTMSDYWAECEEADKPLARNDYPTALTPGLRRFIQEAETWLARNQDEPFRQDLLTLYFDVNWFLKVADVYDEAYSTCLEEMNGDFRIKLFCIDPSAQLAEAMARCRSVVFFSATLSPMSYFRRVLGLAGDATEMSLPSPFPPENLCLPLADRISTLYKYRERTRMDVAHIVDALVSQQAGNYLIFFPSYKYLQMVYELFAAMNPRVKHIVQTPGMSEGEREMFLENFTHNNRLEGKTLVGFAVMGGIFGEGIDLVGDRLTGAAIVGVGLPGISLERDLIKEYFNHLQGTGFEYAYMFPGINRVCQAAGRVIRTAADRGVVVLIGNRFSSHQYNKLLPPHWSPVRIHDDHHLKQILHHFWDV